MQLSYPPGLPISQRKDLIVEAIRKHQVLVIAGDTGSGKTTQLPKMCLEAGLGSRGRIGCTQPRRIAAVSVAERVGEELVAPDAVGYKIRFKDTTTDDTVIKFMTDGVLLSETRGDRCLGQYDTLIIDEAHERSLNIDFLLGFLKQLIRTRPELKLIISSATIDTRKFAAHFDNAPIIKVSGRLHPITLEYRNSETEDEAESASYVDRAVKAAKDLAVEADGGDILVFMPTEQDIRDTIDGLRHVLGDSHLILPLFGRLPAVEQRKIFKRSWQRKVIVATNVAETSLTVPGIRYVVDTGLARIARYNVRSGTTSLRVARISRASCDQRAGRCGRTGPGTCIRLYSEEDYQGRDAFTLPEIQRSNLAEVILQMISLQLGDPALFPFIDSPSSRTLRDGFRILHELGALVNDHSLSKNGRLMARLPLDPCLSRILIEGNAQNSLAEIKVLAAALSLQDPRVRPPEQEQKADERHRPFIDKSSDFLTLLNIWNALHQEERPRSMSRLSKFCKTHFLSWQRMREWQDVYDQIHRLLRENSRFRENTEPASPAAVHRALTCGFLRNIGMKKEKNLYLSAGGKEVRIFPGSGLYNRGGKWIVAAGFFETSQLFARTTATIDVAWLEELGGELCKYSWSEPHWEKKAGRVMALERVSLFGLPIIAGRKVNYGRISKTFAAEARTIFIRSALIEDNLGGRYPFLVHNQNLIQQYREIEEKIRRRNVIVDDEALFAFYDQRLGNVYDRFTLNRYLRRKKKDTFLRMTEADICQTLPDSKELYRFPPTLRSGELELDLSYLFEPGNEADGVTVVIPRHLVPHLDPSLFEWLVPGMLAEKILVLFKRLPKRIRKHLVPMPQSVDKVLDSLELYTGSLYPALERAVLRSCQVSVQRGDWQTEVLPNHLKMRFRLVDDQGVILAESRSFGDIRKSGTQPETVGATTADATLPELEDILPKDFDAIDRRIALTDQNKTVSGIYFPALVFNDATGRLDVRYVSSETEARQCNRIALHQVYGTHFPGEISKLRKQSKQVMASRSASWLALGAGLSGGDLRRAFFGFILDAVFSTAGGEIPSTADFEGRVDTLRQKGLLRTANQIIELVMTVLGQRREVVTLLSSWAARAKKNKSFSQERFKAYQDTLEQILPADFLRLTTVEELEHKPRYLKALALRIERAEHSPVKDDTKAQRLIKPLNRLEQMATFADSSVACQTCKKEYLALIDEFRVSIFAPELGTAQVVSEKKLHQKWQEVENVCRTVE